MDINLLADLLKLAAKYLEKAAIQVEKLYEEEKVGQNPGNSKKEKRRKEKKETNENKESKELSKETKEAKEPKEPKESKESKEIKENKGQKEKPESKDQKDQKPKKEKKESKSQKDSKDEQKIPKKKTAYKIYFDERTAQLRVNPDGKKIQMPEISKIAAKEWKEMTAEEKKKYFDKADEYNIIIEGLPQKTSRKESSDLSDTESDVISPTKKSKNS